MALREFDFGVIKQPSTILGEGIQRPTGGKQEVDFGTLGQSVQVPAPIQEPTPEESWFFTGKTGLGERVGRWFKESERLYQERTAEFEKKMAGKKRTSIFAGKPEIEPIDIMGNMKKVVDYARSDVEPPAGFIDWLLRIGFHGFGRFPLMVTDFMYQHLPKSLVEPVLQSFQDKLDAKRMTPRQRAALANVPADIPFAAAGLEDVIGDPFDLLGEAVFENIMGLARFHGEPYGLFGKEAFLNRWRQDWFGALVGAGIPVGAYMKKSPVTGRSAHMDITPQIREALKSIPKARLPDLPSFGTEEAIPALESWAKDLPEMFGEFPLDVKRRAPAQITYDGVRERAESVVETLELKPFKKQTDVEFVKTKYEAQKPGRQSLVSGKENIIDVDKGLIPVVEMRQYVSVEEGGKVAYHRSSDGTVYKNKFGVPWKTRASTGLTRAAILRQDGIETTPYQLGEGGPWVLVAEEMLPAEGERWAEIDAWSKEREGKLIQPTQESVIEVEPEPIEPVDVNIAAEKQGAPVDPLEPTGWRGLYMDKEDTAAIFEQLNTESYGKSIKAGNPDSMFTYLVNQLNKAANEMDPEVRPQVTRDLLQGMLDNVEEYKDWYYKDTDTVLAMEAYKTFEQSLHDAVKYADQIIYRIEKGVAPIEEFHGGLPLDKLEDFIKRSFADPRERWKALKEEFDLTEQETTKLLDQIDREVGIDTTLHTGIPTTKEFRKWFGKSVVDKVVYHGSPSRFSAFESGRKHGGIGFHFGSREQAINRMKETVRTKIDFEGGAKAKLLSGYVRIENPLYMKDPLGWDVEAFAEAVREQNLNISKEAVRRIDNLNRKYQDKKINLYDSNNKLEQILKDEGYDGIVYDNRVEGKGESYAIFDPNQFKSVENVGSFSDYTSNFFYGGPPTDEISKKVWALYQKIEKAQETSWKDTVRKTAKNVEIYGVDVGGPIRRIFFDMALRGNEWAKQTFINFALARGGSAEGVRQARAAYKRVFGGFNRDMTTLTNRGIASRRVMQLDAPDYPRKGFKFMEGLGRAEHQRFYEREIPEAVKPRIEAFFNVWRDQLRQSREAGLIDERTERLLSKFDYARHELLDLFDPSLEYTTFEGKRVETRESGIQYLKTGEPEELLRIDHDQLMQELIIRNQARIANNRAAQSLYELAKETTDNPIVKIWDKKTPKGRPAKPPKGWERIDVYRDGKKEHLILPNELADAWILHRREISSRAANIARLASGSFLLRPMATGINLGFAFANFIRDAAHIWLVTDRMVGGKWESFYSPHLPKYALQMARDILTVAPDVFLRKGRYKDYIKSGGGMTFMVHQGAPLAKRFKGRLGVLSDVRVGLDRVWDVLSYMGETSELITRTAIFDRARRMGLEANEAAWIARSYLDFGQGGSLAKAVDTAVPYLNATIQGTRGVFRAAIRNQRAFGIKVGWIAATTVALYLANRNNNPEALDSIPQKVKDRYWVITTPWKFLDDDGIEKYFYFKIPKDQGQQFFASASEAITKMMLGEDVNLKDVVSTLTELSPVDTRSWLTPTGSALVAYLGNLDTWPWDRIWKGDPNVEPRAEKEVGMHPMWEDVGNLFNVSPVRTREALSKVFTKGNLYSYLVGQGYNAMLGKVPDQYKSQELAHILARNPTTRRFAGLGNPFIRDVEDLDEIERLTNTKHVEQNYNVDKLVDMKIAGTGSVDEVRKYIMSQDFMDRDRLIERAERREKLKNLPTEHRTWWIVMEGLPVEARAAAFKKKWDKSSEAERGQIRRGMGMMEGILTEDFWYYLQRQK